MDKTLKTIFEGILLGEDAEGEKVYLTISESTEAVKQLQELVKECVPERIKDHPQDPFWEDGMSSNAKMTGYNQAIEDITKALREKGLLC